MAPPYFRILKTPNLTDGNKSGGPFRKLPFGGRLASLEVDRVAPPHRRHITNVLRGTYASSTLHNGNSASPVRPRNAVHTTNILNPSGFSDSLQSATYHASDHDARKPRTLPYAAAALNESYSLYSLHKLQNHTRSLHLQNQVNSTSPSPSPTTPDHTANAHSPILSLLLVGIFIAVVMMLCCKVFKGNACNSRKERTKLDLAEKGMGDNILIVKVQEPGGGNGDENG